MEDTQQLNAELDELKFNHLHEQILLLNQQLSSSEQALMKLREQCRELTQESHEQVGEVFQSLHITLDNFRQFIEEIDISGNRAALTNLSQRQDDAIYSLESTSVQYLSEIKYCVDKINTGLDKNAERWERAANYLLTNTAEISQILNVDEFKKISAQSCHSVEHSAKGAIQQVKKMSQWLHWKNLAMVATASIIAVIFSNWYLTDQYPWETHKTIVTERVYGKALMHAWPDLDKRSQQQIARHLPKNLA